MRLLINFFGVFRFGLILIMLPVFMNAQEQLSGTIIYYDKCHDSQFPVSNAFDNNTNTYFRSCPPFGNWIGLDLGEKQIITKVAFNPRMDSDYRARLQLGIFEGANQPDFGDGIPLAIIPDLTERKLNEIDVECSRGFRYVRFVFPYAQQSGKSSYMAELKFFGYKGAGDDSKLPQLTNLPTISIHTVDGQDITSKEEYVKGVISVVFDDGTRFHTDSIEIRGRGNNSWTHPKKPYRIKLANSTRLMRLPAKAKNWTLINNYGDKSLIRNALAFDFSRRLEMPYTSPAEMVDVVLNGDYKGSYNLSDQIDVRTNRVDIQEMTPYHLTGGYLIEIDAYADTEPKKFTSQHYSIPVSIKYPDDDDITLAQEQYIASHFEKFVQSVSGSQFKHPVNGFRKYLDMYTFYRHFLVGELAGNTDTYWSVRMSKKADEDKFYFGPVWDFDLGFENDSRTYSITEWANSDNQWLCFTNRSSAAGGTKDMIKRILSDETALSELEATYAYYRNTNVISGDILTSKVDEFAELIDQSQQLNFKRWDIMYTKVHLNPVVHGGYQAEVENVRNFVSNRIDWMDQKLNFSLYSQVSELNTPTGVHVSTNQHTIRLKVLDACNIEVFDISGKRVAVATLQDNDYHEIKAQRGVYVIRVSGSIKQNSTIKCIVM